MRLHPHVRLQVPGAVSGILAEIGFSLLLGLAGCVACLVAALALGCL
jgi:hypothetical protein